MGTNKKKCSDDPEFVTTGLNAAKDLVLEASTVDVL